MVKYLCLSAWVHVLVHGYVSVTDLPAVSSLRQHACLNTIRHQFQRQLSQRQSQSQPSPFGMAVSTPAQQSQREVHNITRISPSPSRLDASLSASSQRPSSTRGTPHHPLVPAPAVLTPAPVLSMPGTLSPYPSLLTATPVPSLMAASLTSTPMQARSVRRSRYLPTGISTPSRLDTSPSHDPFQPQPQPQLRSV